MFTETEILQANKTCSCGCVIKNSIVPKWIMENIPRDKSILDFGAGKQAYHARNLTKEGFTKVDAHEFGKNSRKRIHTTKALEKEYDVVYASNVLNVQTSKEMMRGTLQLIKDVTSVNGVFVFNYPKSPRKNDLILAEVLEIVKEFFTTIEYDGNGIFISKKSEGEKV